MSLVTLYFLACVPNLEVQPAGILTIGEIGIELA